MDRTPDDFQFITADDLARKLGVTRQTVYRQVELGVLPRPYYIASRAARWRVDEVLQALEARRLAPREALERGIRPKAARERRRHPSSKPAAET